MAKRGREARIYKYKCTITEEEFKVTTKSKTPDELVSVRAYYEMNPEEDDRPESIVKKLGDLPEAPSQELLDDDLEE